MLGSLGAKYFERGYCETYYWITYYSEIYIAITIKYLIGSSKAYIDKTDSKTLVKIS